MDHDPEKCPNALKIESLEKQMNEFKNNTNTSIKTLYEKIDKIFDKIEALTARITAAAIGIICTIIGGIIVAVIMFLINKGGTP